MCAWFDAYEIDVDRAMHAKERAEALIRDKAEVVDFMRAELALQRAITRLKVSGK